MSKFLTSLVFVYKSMSLTLRHHVIVNLNVNEITCSFCTTKQTDDPTRVTQFESFLIVSTETGKKYLKISQMSFHVGLE